MPILRKVPNLIQQDKFDLQTSKTSNCLLILEHGFLVCLIKLELRLVIFTGYGFRFDDSEVMLILNLAIKSSSLFRLDLPCLG